MLNGEDLWHVDSRVGDWDHPWHFRTNKNYSLWVFEYPDGAFVNLAVPDVEEYLSSSGEPVANIAIELEGWARSQFGGAVEDAVEEEPQGESE